MYSGEEAVIELCCCLSWSALNRVLGIGWTDWNAKTRTVLEDEFVLSERDAGV